jgi:hypothetical protein
MRVCYFTDKKFINGEVLDDVYRVHLRANNDGSYTLEIFTKDGRTVYIDMWQLRSIT